MCDSFNNNSKMALHILKPHPLLEISRGCQQLMQKITVALGYTRIILLSRVTSLGNLIQKKACWGNLPVKQFGLKKFFSEQIRKKSIIVISILVWFFSTFWKSEREKGKVTRFSIHFTSKCFFFVKTPPPHRTAYMESGFLHRFHLFILTDKASHRP